jgi:hypothetical protein
VKNGFYYFYPSKHEDEGGNKLSMLGPGGAFFVNGGSGCSNCGRYVGSYYNYPFELLGDVTGGLRFDALNHHFVTPDADTPGLVLSLSPDGYSMNGGEAHDVLERVKKHALARFSSNYTVGFIPPPSDSPRQHALEVKLAPKSSGKVTEGKRSATY